MSERPREELGVVQETFFGWVEDMINGSVDEVGHFPEIARVRTADGQVEEYVLRGDQDVTKGNFVRIVATTYKFSGVPWTAFKLIPVDKPPQPVKV